MDLLATVDSVRPDLPHLRDVIDLSRWEELVSSPVGDLPAVGPEDVAQIQYTSGTTGFPKGAVLPHRGLVMTVGCSRRSRIPTRDVWINPMPMFHTAGCVLVTLGALQTGATHVLPAGFDPAVMLDLFEAESGTLMLGVPTMLIRHAGRPRCTHAIVQLGGSPVGRRPGSARAGPPSSRAARCRRDHRFRSDRGVALRHPHPPADPDPDWVHTVGRPLPATEVRIAIPSRGSLSRSASSGRCARAATAMMTGYFDDPAGTAGPSTPEGWLHTGDLGRMDEHGYLHMPGRLKDMIIRGGENIYPREIEDLLLTHPTSRMQRWSASPTRRWESR